MGLSEDNKIIKRIYVGIFTPHSNIITLLRNGAVGFNSVSNMNILYFTKFFSLLANRIITKTPIDDPSTVLTVQDLSICPSSLYLNPCRPCSFHHYFAWTIPCSHT